MIEEKNIKELVVSKIEDSELFLVDIKVGASNDIRVLVDSMEGVRIEECVSLSKALNADLELQDDNYSLEVSSPGIGEPLVVMQQYEKNIGRDVEVLLLDGKKKKGKLLSVSKESIEVEVIEKMIPEGGSQKKKKDVPVKKTFAFNEFKSVTIVITF